LRVSCGFFGKVGEVFGESADDGKEDDVWELVGVEAADAGDGCLCLVVLCFGEEEAFCCAFDLVLPAVDGLDFGDEVDAGCESFADERGGYGACLLEGPDGGVDELCHSGL